jgi:hypothetical protein
VTAEQAPNGTAERQSKTTTAPRLWRMWEWVPDEERLDPIRVPAPPGGMPFDEWMGTSDSVGDTFGDPQGACWVRVHYRFDWTHCKHDSAFYVKLAVGEDYQHVLIENVDSLVKLLRYIAPVIHLAGSPSAAELERRRQFNKAQGWDLEDEEDAGDGATCCS